jgi:hypothetical protein
MINLLVGVDISICVGIGARAIKVVARVCVTIQVRVVREDRAVVRAAEGAEPCRETCRR